MSIPGAVVELNREIERLTKIRDSLLLDPVGGGQHAQIGPVVRQKRNYVRSVQGRSAQSTLPKKQAGAKKPAQVKAGSSPKKRVVSAATRKKMSDAAKARAAARLEAAK